MFPNKNFNLGEDLGQCCGAPGTGDCGGYSGGKSALEHYQDGLFGEPKLTTWTRRLQALSLVDIFLSTNQRPSWISSFKFWFYAGGEAAEVYWVSNAYHRGGYAYRLCRVPDGQYWKVTEECFQQGHLNFAGRKYSLFEVVWILNTILRENFLDRMGTLGFQGKVLQLCLDPRGLDHDEDRDNTRRVRMGQNKPS